MTVIKVKWALNKCSFVAHKCQKDASYCVSDIQVTAATIWENTEMFFKNVFWEITCFLKMPGFLLRCCFGQFQGDYDMHEAHVPTAAIFGKHGLLCKRASRIRAPICCNLTKGQNKMGVIQWSSHRLDWVDCPLRSCGHCPVTQTGALYIRMAHLGRNGQDGQNPTSWPCLQ